MDKVIYTGEAPKEELFEELNILLSRFIRELAAKKKKLSQIIMMVNSTIV